MIEYMWRKGWLDRKESNQLIHAKLKSRKDEANEYV